MIFYLVILYTVIIFGTETIEVAIASNVITIPKEISDRIDFLRLITSPSTHCRINSPINLNPSNSNVVSDTSFEDLLDILKAEKTNAKLKLINSLDSSRLVNLALTVQYLGCPEVEDNLYAYFLRNISRFPTIKNIPDIYKKIRLKLIQNIMDYLEENPVLLEKINQPILNGSIKTLPTETDTPRTKTRLVKMNTRKTAHWLLKSPTILRHIQLKKLDLTPQRTTLEGSVFSIVDNAPTLNILPDFLSFFPQVTVLKLTGNKLTSFDLALPNLTMLDLSIMPLRNIDVTDCTSLEELNIGNTEIEELDLSDLPKLRELHAPLNHNLIKATLSSLTKLKRINFKSSEHLETLKLDSLTSLERLNIQGTQISIDSVPKYLRLTII